MGFMEEGEGLEGANRKKKIRVKISKIGKNQNFFVWTLEQHWNHL